MALGATPVEAAMAVMVALRALPVATAYLGGRLPQADHDGLDQAVQVSEAREAENDEEDDCEQAGLGVWIADAALQQDMAEALAEKAEHLGNDAEAAAVEPACTDKDAEAGAEQAEHTDSDAEVEAEKAERGGFCSRGRALADCVQGARGRGGSDQAGAGRTEGRCAGRDGRLRDHGFRAGDCAGRERGLGGV